MYHSMIIEDSLVSDPSLELAARVKYARANKLWSQDDLAVAAHLSRPTIARIESGSWKPRMRTLAAVAGALGVTARDLVSEPALLWADAPR